MRISGSWIVAFCAIGAMVVFLFLVLAAPDGDSPKPANTRKTAVPPVPISTTEMTLFPETREEHDDIQDKLCQADKPGVCPE